MLEKDNGLFVGKDNRTNHKAIYKTSISAFNLVKKHINSFPKDKSHYCKHDSCKLYLSSDLNKAIMYYSLQKIFVGKKIFFLILFFYLYIHLIENVWVQHKQRKKVAIQMKNDNKNQICLGQ